MDKEKLEYEKPKMCIQTVTYEDVLTTSNPNPDFDGGQSGLSAW